MFAENLHAWLFRVHLSNVVYHILDINHDLVLQQFIQAVNLYILLVKRFNAKVFSLGCVAHSLQEADSLFKNKYWSIISAEQVISDKNICCMCSASEKNINILN